MQCWCPAGPLLERFCAGPSCWAPLGDPFGRSGAVLMPQKLIGRETSRGQNSLICLGPLQDCGFWDAPLGSSQGTWNRLGAVL
eukprot:6237773-Pyramimonas_sp.AAC.1